MRGYTQQDVQQLARVLTGVGINAGDAPRLQPEWQRAVPCAAAPSSSIRRATTSAPRRCSATRVEGKGFDEVEKAVDADRAPAGLRALHLAAARHLLRRRQSAAAAGRAHGADLPAHRRRHRRGAAHACSCRRSSTPRSAASSRIRCVTWSPRCACLRRPPDQQYATVLNWLNALGEAPFGHQTPTAIR